MERTRLNPILMSQRKATLDKGLAFSYFLAAVLAASSLLVIAGFLLVEGLKPFFATYSVNDQPYRINFWAFLGGFSWFDLPAESGIFFLTVNTLIITLLASLIAIPLSVLTALFITRIAPKKIGVCIAFAVELLSSIPSVVYGLFGRGLITNGVDWLALALGFQSKGGLSLLSGALVLALMISPIITSLSVNSMQTIPASMLAASLALGASKTETNFKVVLPYAANGIFAGVILGIGRALGEATALSMVIGNAGTGPTFDLFGITSTLSTTMLLGYNEATGMNADIRFSIGLVLILLIVGIDVLLVMLKKGKDKRDGLLS
jgi:phosphate transport system permease protein